MNSQFIKKVLTLAVFSFLFVMVLTACNRAEPPLDDAVTPYAPTAEPQSENPVDADENDEMEEVATEEINEEIDTELLPEGVEIVNDAAAHFSFDVPEYMEEFFVPEEILNVLFEEIFDLDQMVELGLAAHGIPHAGASEARYFWIWNRILPFNINHLLTFTDPEATEIQNEAYGSFLAAMSSLKRWYDSDITNNGIEFWGGFLIEFVDPDHHRETYHAFAYPNMSRAQWDLAQQTLNDFHLDLELRRASFAMFDPDVMIEQRTLMNYPFRGVIDLG